MNDWQLGAEKLEHLLDLARTAETDFEKAAVFAAAKALESMFDADTDERLGAQQLNTYAMEKVASACWFIMAIVGYDITNGHDADRLAVFAMGDISTLKRVLRDGSDNGVAQ